ncbi:hypothetical protein ig2599ANME_0936, partial [groundwater metagenome]
SVGVILSKVSEHNEYVWFSTFQQLSPIPEVCSFPFILRIAGGGYAPALPASKKMDSIAIPATILILLHLILIDNMSNPIFINHVVI